MQSGKGGSSKIEIAQYYEKLSKQEMQYEIR